MPPHLAFEQVDVRRGKVQAVSGVSLAIGRGRFVALVGASGSGKTSLLKTVNRLVEISAGRVVIDGADTAALPAPQLRRRIGYVFQEIGLFPHFSVAENIAITPRLLGWDPARIDARVRELLDLVELPARYAARWASELSGGQAQRVGIARALAAGPELLLMDEPFGALDPLTRIALAEKVRALQAALGLTVLMVTHDLTEALLTADEVAVLATGKLLAVLPPRALIAGDGGAEVQALLDAPRRQAERLAALA